MTTTELTAAGGMLTAKQRRILRAQVSRTLPAMASERAAWAAGRSGRGRVDLDGLRVPDSRAAREAEEMARESLSLPVLEHSYRTYLFGRALADLDDAPYDDEVVYIACLLHDLNLENPTPGKCFAVAGAERAESFALEAGLEPNRARAVGAAIAAHINPGVAADTGGEGFVSTGASVDVIGARITDLDRTWVTHVLQRHPRHQFKRRFLEAFHTEARVTPRGRTALLMHTGLGVAVRLSPFPE